MLRVNLISEKSISKLASTMWVGQEGFWGYPLFNRIVLDDINGRFCPLEWTKQRTNSAPQKLKKKATGDGLTS